MRFEIELACKTGADINRAGDKDLASEEVLNLALYDQADPNNLFLTEVDKEKFLKLQARQNLKIEQFSAFGCHVQSLLNHCID